MCRGPCRVARVAENDVLLVPIRDGEFALARIVWQRGLSVLIVAYADVVGADGPGDLAEREWEPILVVPTVSVLIDDGQWRIAGNWAPALDVPIPVYKVEIESEFYEQRIDGSIGPRLSDEEAARRTNPGSYSPAVLEWALRAYHGFGAWLPAYEGLVAPRTVAAEEPSPSAAGQVDDHAVMLHLSLGADGFGSEDARGAVRALERDIVAALADASLGDLDGDEFGGGEAVLYLYGPDADRLFAAVEPLVRESTLRPAHAILRYEDSTRRIAF